MYVYVFACINDISIYIFNVSDSICMYLHVYVCIHMYPFLSYYIFIVSKCILHVSDSILIVFAAGLRLLHPATAPLSRNSVSFQPVC
jgi:hypothetical protein